MSDLFGIGAGMSALGQGSTGAASYYFQEKDTRKAARHARQWQQMMASTAYQRTKADMEAAGINPILAVTRGMSPAGVPGTAPQEIPNMDLGGDVLGGAERFVSGVQQAKAMRKTLDLLDERVRTQEAETFATSQQGYESMRRRHFLQSQMDKGLIDAQVNSANASSAVQNVEAILRSKQIPGASAISDFEGSDFGRRMLQFERAVKTVNPLSGIFK